jgi:methionyl-tRNA formyltransferase
MGASLKIVFLTTDDPLYLPAFFERVLDARGVSCSVFVTPPLYKGQSFKAAALRYMRTFGWRPSLELARRTLAAKLRRQSIADVCRRYGVECQVVRDVNAPDFLERLRLIGTELIVSVSCPQIFRQPLIELPPKGCLNIHGAILPAYRGVMPSFWMLLNGEKEAGVSVFFVNEEIDAGELCGQQTFEIRDEDTLDELLRRSKRVAAELLLEVLDDIDAGTVARKPLDLTEGSYYSWPDRTAARRFHSLGRRLW